MTQNPVVMEVNYAMRETFFINQQQTKGMKLTANPALGLFHVWVGSSGAKLVRVMKLTTIIILAACLQSSANGIAQNTVTFSGKDVNLEMVFSAIKKQTTYRFFFNTSIIQNASKITIEVRNAPIEQVMNLALKDQSLTFAIKGRTIFVMKKPEEEKQSSQVMPLQGDPVTVSGRVTDEQGNPLVGANVKVKGTNNGVTTDGQGRFTLANVDGNGMLEVSFVGHETQLLPVKGKTMFTVALGQKVGVLDETVVIAYGTTTRRLSTGNISSVKAIDIEKQPVNNPLLALQGRVPGLIITQSSGFTGSAIKVQVQGQTSIGVGIGSDPLYVIDGVPFPSRSLFTLSAIQGTAGSAPNQAGIQTGSVNPLSFINPSEIESIDVLKDADATAIYGSRAANGAILITTKKGKVGKTKVDFNLQTGAGNVSHFLDVLNREEYLEMRNEAFKNDGITPRSTDYDINGTWDTTKSTNWQKELIGGTSRYTNLNSSVSGGTVNTQFLLSAGYHKETTVFPGDLADQKGSLHFNVNNVSPSQKFKLQLSGSYLIDNNQMISSDLTSVAVSMSPVAPNLYNDDGSLNWALLANGNSTWVNPLSFLYNEYSNKTSNLIGNLITSYEILRGLNIKASFGYNKLQSEQYKISPLQSVRPERRAATLRSSDFSFSSINNWIIEPSLEYKFSINELKVNTLIGSTFLQNDNDYRGQSGSGYSSDVFIKDINSAPTKSASGYFSLYKYNALFGRVTGSWNDKYIVNFTARRDGSSRFGSQNLFHNFGSIAGSWIFSKESLIANKLPFVSFGKFRISYGTTGNDQIGDYRYLNLYNSVTGIGVAYQNSTGLVPNGLPNSYLQWEETKKLQFGLDLGFFNDRILLNANYYQNRCSNQLLDYMLPITAGFPSITRNYPAAIQNTGWELSLNTLIIKTASLTWTNSINLTVPRNKLLKFPDIESSSYATMYTVGKPVTIRRAYKYLGVDQTTGIYNFLAQDGSVTSKPISNDLTEIVNTSPKYYGGFQNSISYKGFQFDILFQFVKQIGSNSYYLFGDRVGQLLSDGRGNQPENILNRWKKTGDISVVQRAYISNSNLSTAEVRALQSDVVYTDASYVRIKNASLSWQVPQSWQRKIATHDVKIYVQGQNLFTITKYKGLDPEIIGSQSLPPLRVVTIGMQVNF
ncbi:TonB-linked outer membrane protein, SusC/RagA family [Niastella yeongjuensis]|nr:TonB-linked outer membrane protein, SusC/RagA family [Niastella yeongjuensis]